MSTFSSAVLQVLVIMKPKNIRCMKFFLTLLNIICILTGLTLMAISVMNMSDKKARPDQEPSSKGMLAFCLTLGLGLVATAIIGCVGALREHVKTLYVYACFFTFLVSMEVLVAVGGALMNAWVEQTSDIRVQLYKNSTVEDETARQEYWDVVQSENRCCGARGPQDYSILELEIPASCCSRAHPLREGGARRHLHATCLAEKSYYARGCSEALQQKRAFHAKFIAATGVAFSLVELFCIFLSLWMARTIRVERRKLQQNLQAHFET